MSGGGAVLRAAGVSRWFGRWRRAGLAARLSKARQPSDRAGPLAYLLSTALLSKPVPPWP